MIFDEEKLSPTYKFRQGTPGMSYALDVANRYGICEEIVTKAKDFIAKSEHSETNDLLSILQKKLDAANKLEDQLEKKERQLQDLEKKLNNDDKVLKQRREKLLSEVKEEKNQIIEKTKKEVEEIISALKQDGIKIHEAGRLRNQLDELRDNEEMVVYDEEIRVNDYVEIPSLGISGRVTRINGKKARIERESGLSFDVEIDRLHKIEAPKEIKREKATSNLDSSIGENIGLELNIIGMHVEEAQYALIKYIDNCRLKRYKNVRIIHGFGSGALRKMTREYLDKQSDLTYRAGDGSEGGGGATVVIFK